eukprot:XP_001690329.1 predicted protein [Chlamydomonas reinhardtii]
MLALGILCLIAIRLPCAMGESVDFNLPKGYDVTQDWTQSITASGTKCSFAERAAYKPPPLCPPPRTPVPRAQAVQLGMQFAPILFQHPLNHSLLTDPAHWFEQASKWEKGTWWPAGRVSLPAGAGAQPLEYDSSMGLFASRLATPRLNTSTLEVDFDVVSGSEVRRRAVVDPVVGGRLTGRVWYTAFRPFNDTTGEMFPHSYVFSYNYFYPWWVDLGGDLVHVKLWVCEDDLYREDAAAAVRRVQFSPHGWLPEFDCDCESGECEYEVRVRGEGTAGAGLKPVGHGLAGRGGCAAAGDLLGRSGLFSHSNWPKPSPLYIYQKIKVKSIMNMEGLYIGGRYSCGPGALTHPRNTHWLPYVSEMTPEQAAVDFLSFGSMLLILGQLTFLVLATTINYVGLRTGAAIKSAMQLTRKSATTALQAKRHGSWPKLLVLGRTGAKANAGGGGGDAVGCRCGWPATAHRVRRATGHYRRPGSQQDAASGAFITASTAAAVTNACGANPDTTPHRTYRAPYLNPLDMVCSATNTDVLRHGTRIAAHLVSECGGTRQLARK